jgi:hypothetical protein
MHISQLPKSPILRRPPAPDLVIEEIQTRPMHPRAGEPVWLDVVVRNEGDAAAGAFQVQVRAPGLMDQAAAQGLAAGRQMAFRSLGPLWTNASDSLIWVDGEVDHQHQVPESQEGNNWVKLALHLDPARR